MFSMLYVGIDIGAETTTAINISPEGKVLEYVRNNKSAVGTSMLLKVMSEILQISITHMDDDKYRADNKIGLSNVCSVFAESEAVSYLSHGTPAEEILSGAHEAVVDQLVGLLSRVDIIPDIVATGGAARNRVIIESLSERIGHPVSVPPEPEMAAALGAALLTREKGGQR
jgi:(R)-2-hydroxyacyl-CoA dehydratese activating ATPase